ncbi:MAG: spermine synthase [Candidatus Omnitrophota bacterium]
MNYLTVLVIGLSGIVVQVLLLRELLVSFYGNELTLGIILANWILAEASGVFISGKFIERVKNKANVFIILQVLFSILLPVSIYLSRTFKSLIGIPFGEGVGLYTIFYASFLIILPVGFCHGALFSSLCKICSIKIKDLAGAIGKVYAWETIGTICGGIILTYLFIPYLNSFQIVFILSVINLAACLFFFKDTAKVLKYIVLVLIFTASIFSLQGGIKYLNKLSINKQWKQQEILDYRNSNYGNIVVTKREGQYTFFYNGIPVITTPYPDKQFVQEFGNLPLLFSKSPKEVLVISAGAGGLINEILKHPVKKIDYAELDPLLIEMLRQYPSELTQKELTDPRVNIMNLDGRFFVKNTPNKYDVILIGLSKPSDLSANRLFTREFFFLAKERLNPDGIVALTLPGSLTYLSRELKDINACVLNGLKDSYAYVRVIPGDYNMFLASNSRDILEITPDIITRKIERKNIRTDILVPAYINFRLNKAWSDWFQRSLTGATEKVNQDLRPFAVFQMLILWNKQFSPGLAYIFGMLGNLNTGFLAVLILGITLILFCIFCRKRSTSPAIVYSIATTGLFGMLANLVLIFSFQVFYGYLYYMIGILISIFMAGIALGSIFMTTALKRIKDGLRLFIELEAGIIVFSCIMAVTLTRFMWSARHIPLIFATLLFISGLFLGLEFPLASRIYPGRKEEAGNTVGVLYSADLIGGWVAGVLGSIILLPVLGLFNTCLVIIMFKLSSLFLLGTPNLLKPRVSPK